MAPSRPTHTGLPAARQHRGRQHSSRACGRPQCESAVPLRPCQVASLSLSSKICCVKISAPMTACVLGCIIDASVCMLDIAAAVLLLPGHAFFCNMRFFLACCTSHDFRQAAHLGLHQIDGLPQLHVHMHPLILIILSLVSRCVALVGVLRGDRVLSPYTTMMGAEALAAATCEPGASSTDPMILSMLLSEAADLGHHLFSLFMHPARELLQ